MNVQLRTALVLAGLAMLPTTALAQAHSHDHAATTIAIAPSSPMTEGEVRKVNQVDATMTLRHGPLENLGMPAMTMTFRVKDPAMLGQVKEGDKVRFVADNVGGKLTVVQLEAAR